MIVRTKEVVFEGGAKVTIAELTWEQLENITTRAKPNGSREIAVQNAELVCMSLNNAQAPDAPPWTTERCIKEMGQKIFMVILPQEIMELNGFESRVKKDEAQKPGDTPGETPAVSVN